MTATATQATIDQLHISAYKSPTDGPEADGTSSWDSITLVLVEIEGGGHTGIGYTYGNQSIAHLIHTQLAKKIEGRDVINIPGALCNAHRLELSVHCASSASKYPCLAIMALRPMEYFHDHHRIETMLFDGARTPKEGALWPDLSRPGTRLEFKHADVEPYLVWKS